MAEQDNGKIEPVEKMMKRYPDEWIFFEVVERDEYERPCRGILKAHHPDRDVLHEIIMKTPRKRFAVWYTGRIMPEGCEVLL